MAACEAIRRHCLQDTGVIADDSASITIGSRTLPSRYFLAPLAGYTHLAFRTAVRELGGLGLATTDLVQATMLLSGTRKSLELVATTPADRPLSVQIFSGNSDELVRAAQWLEEHGYEGVDINMGCPMAKVNGQGGGARLMCDTEGARSTVAAVVDAVDLPVTVKMRLGWDADQITAPLLAREFEQVGVAAITVHGRTRAQGFHGNVDLDGIRQVVAAVDAIPIVGNGDVRTVADALRMRKLTGCDAVAVGRGAMMDPWIFRKLVAVREGEAPAEPPQVVGTRPPCLEFRTSAATKSADEVKEVPWEPTPDELVAFLVRHFTLMTEQHGDYSCTLFRKFAAWYGAKLGIPEDLEDRLRRFESFAEFNEIVEQIHRRHGERESSVPTALVKVPNGPNERW